MTRPALHAVLLRDRALVLVGLAAVTALAWAYLLAGSGPHGGAMQAAPSLAMPQARAWHTADTALLFALWAVMMVAMMAPAAAPLLLVFARARRRKGGRVLGSAAALLTGYLLVWTGFAALAALAQAALHHAALAAAPAAAASARVGGALLLAAGAFQFTPLKHACLAHCRSPLGFLASEWREGRFGALRLGMKHGVFCLGCCWLLMTVMLVTGAMNLLWMLALTLLLLAEKAAPRGEWIARVAGVGLSVAGLVLLLG